MIFLFFTSPLAPLEAEICPIEVWYGMAVVVPYQTSIGHISAPRGARGEVKEENHQNLSEKFRGSQIQSSSKGLAARQR